MRETGLREKVAVVTGGAAGLGSATAVRFAEEGCRVAIWDVQESAAASVLETLGSTDVDRMFCRVDVTDAAAVDAALSTVVARWGRIDILVNNAGILRDAQLVKWKDGMVSARLSEEDFDAVIGVNLRGVFLCTRAAVPHMIAAAEASCSTRRQSQGSLATSGKPATARRRPE